MKIINLKNMMKKFIAMMLGVAVFFTAIPAFVLQAETTTTSALTVSSTTVTAGNSVSVYVNAQNWENIAGLNFAIYYDSSAFKLSNTYNGSLMGSTVADVNKNTEGVVTTSFLSVDGISGSGQVMRIVFTSLSTAKAGDYDLELVVSEAYNTNFEDVTISKTSGKITINEKTVTEGTATFLAVPSKTALETSEEFTYQIKSSSIGKLAGGDYEIRYDAEYLEVVDVALGTPFTTGTAVTSIKKDVAGYIKVSHADIQAIRASYGTVLFTVTFMTKDIGVSSTSIDFSATGLTDEGLNSMSSSAIKKTISIKEREQEVTYPAFQMIWDGVTHEDRTVQVDVVLPGEAVISAGDFAISYETNKMVCVKAETDSALSTAGGLLITKEDIGNGTISFSYVNTNPTNIDTVVLHLAFEIKDGYFGSTRLVAIGKDVVNASFEDVTLSFPKTTMYFNSIEGCNIPYLLNHYGYTGKEICPEININGLLQGRDYEVTYENNINVGTATITITGLGNYTGSIVKTFEIKMPVDISGISEESIGGIETSYVYSGKDITPKVTIEGMEENQDYIVSYSNNRNVGTATITINGIGCYCGSITRTFQIEYLLIHTIPEDSIHGLEQSFIYTGKGIEPIVSIDGFTRGVDFELSYVNNINAGTAMVNISGINNCKGSVSLEFDIVQAEQEITVQELWKVGMDVDKFSLNATFMQEEGVILYESNNPDVVEVDATGVVTVHNVGEATIVLSVPETVNYKATSKTITVIVEPICTVNLVRSGSNMDIVLPGKALISSGTFTMSYDNEKMLISITDYLGNPLKNVKLSVSLNGTKNYTTDSKGQIKVSTAGFAPGSYPINISFEGNEIYSESNSTTKLTVIKTKTKLTADSISTSYNENNLQN